MRGCLCFLAIHIFLTTLSIRSNAQGAEYSVRQPSMEVNAFSQDDDGYVWMATSRGLARFNGSGYKVWYATNDDKGISNDNIMSICHDDSGCLWIGTECGVTYLDKEGFVNTGEAVYNPVSSIVEMDQDHILVLGKDGLVKFRKEGPTAVAVHSSLGTSWLEDIVVTSDNEVWFAKTLNDSTYLYVLDSDLKEKEVKYLSSGLNVAGICEHPSGKIYLASDKGFLRFDMQTRAGERAGELDRVIGGRKIHFMLPYRRDELLVGVAGKGFYAYNPQEEKLRHVILQQTLSADSYVCFVDKDDRIWLSDKQSAIRTYNPRGVYVHYNPQGEDQIGDASHLFLDKENNLWMNLSGDICCIDPLNGNVIWKNDDEQSCRAMLIDSQGFMWAIFGQNEVRKFALSGGRPSLMKSYEMKEGVFSLAEDSDGRIWMSSVRQLYVLDKADELKVVSPPGNLPFTLLLSDSYTRRLFMFTVRDGLYEIKGETEFVPVQTNGIKGISYVMCASDSTMWLGTYNEGLVCIDEVEGKITNYGKESGLVDLSIRSILEDDAGKIWFSTNSNIVKFDREEEAFVTVHDDWFVEGRSYSLVSAANGKYDFLYFGGSAGITRVDASIPFPSVGDMKLNLEKLQINGKDMNPEIEELVLSHENSLVNFTFAGLEFDSGPYLLYAYMLEGYDKAWTYIYGTGRAIYNHLPPGKYVFRARARHTDGHWSDNELAIPIIVKRKPASILLVLGIIVVLAGLVAVLILFWKKGKKAEVLISQEGNDAEESPWYCTSDMNEADKALMEKTVELLEANLDNDRYTVNDLAKDLSMSYSSMYAKIKGLTEKTPQHFMTEHRMRKAEEFLKTGLFSVSEVSYKVGSSSPMTFSREFKKFFGYPPSTILKDKAAEKDSDQNL